MLEQVEMEVEIPLVRAHALPASMRLIFQPKQKLPFVKAEDLAPGKYFLNRHVVTGRKLGMPRTGDLLADGTRQEMTSTRCAVLARLDYAQSNPWKRFFCRSYMAGWENLGNRGYSYGYQSIATSFCRQI
jgi:hypothetical protein